MRSVFAFSVFALPILLAASCADPVEETCRDDDDCPSGQICQQGECETKEKSPDGELCQKNSDCQSDFCLLTAQSSNCARPCQDFGQCNPGDTCGLVQQLDQLVTSVCVASGPGERQEGEVCQQDSDCHSNLCFDFLCSQMCTQCPDGQACVDTRVTRHNQAVDIKTCQATFFLDYSDLGPVATPTSGSDEIRISVPPGQTSFTVILIDEDGLRVAARSLIAPDNTVLLNIGDSDIDIIPGYSYPGAAALLVPNSDDPAALVQAGEYRLKVGTFDPLDWEALTPMAGSIEQVRVLYEANQFRGGLLDLNLHFATATGIHHETAHQEPFVTALLNQMQAFYLNLAGIHLGQINYGYLPPEHAVVETGDEIRTICTNFSEPGPHGTAVNIFLIHDLSFTAGFSGGIPGPPGIFGGPASGIVAEKLNNGMRTGVLLAHETGHFLGLRHTTETSGDRFDPIADTPQCESGTEIQDCPDYENLMFPIFPLSADLTLSAGQRGVLRGNPLLHQTVLENACPLGSVIDLSDSGFATGHTAGDNSSSGSCGGAAGDERFHLYRVTSSGLSSLQITVRGFDFAPVVYLKSESCDGSGSELACNSGQIGEDIVLEVQQPPAGAYFIAVDSSGTGSGDYILSVVETQ